MKLFALIIVGFMVVASTNILENVTPDYQNSARLDTDISTATTYCNVPEEEWNKTYGGGANDEGWIVQQTNDGGYILTGYTESYGSGSSDIWLVKTDVQGNELWAKTYGGRRNDFSRTVQQTSDGGYIIGGTTGSFGNGGEDIWVIKTDASGNVLWDKTFGGVNDDNCFAILQLPSDDYIVMGDWDLSGTADLYAMKLDSMGNELWIRFYSGNNLGFGHSLQMTADGGLILFGGINVYGDLDMWLVKVDANGTMMWEKTFGQRTSEIGTSIVETKDNGFILGGWVLSSEFNKSILLIKTDDEGNKQWERNIDAGHSEEPYVNALGLDETNDGGCIIAGEKIVANDKNAWLIKTDVNGNILWDMTIGGLSDDYSCGVQQIVNGTYIVTGATSSYGAGQKDIWLIKVSQQQETLPPLQPIIEGPTTGKRGNQYVYGSSTSDPDGDQIYFMWDWGDGTSSEWLGPYLSGAQCNASHIWMSSGTYAIKVKAKDVNGAESEWSDPLHVSMPKTYEKTLLKILVKILAWLNEVNK